LSPVAAGEDVGLVGAEDVVDEDAGFVSALGDALAEPALATCVESSPPPQPPHDASAAKAMYNET
jgi:hypothetical protein